MTNKHENKDIALLNDKAVSEILGSVSNMEVISIEHNAFLQNHKEHLGKVLANTHIWRTKEQKESIISDYNCPTAHSKFHQAMLEQKVQFDQSMYLAKDFEMKKLEMQELNLDLEELTDSPRDMLKSKKLQIEIQFFQYELQNMKTAMNYRMKEVIDWQSMQDNLLTQLRNLNMSEEQIWSKDSGQALSMFLKSMDSLQNLPNTQDVGERNNLISLAAFSYKRMKDSGQLVEAEKVCTKRQLNSLEFIKDMK